MRLTPTLMLSGVFFLLVNWFGFIKMLKGYTDLGERVISFYFPCNLKGFVVIGFVKLVAYIISKYVLR